MTAHKLHAGVKFLGVLIDNKLTWKSHIDMLRSKISKSIVIIYKANMYWISVCLTLYYSLILPYLSYCCEVRRNMYKTNIECVYLLQKKAIIIVCNVGYQYHTNELYCELNVLKLHDLIKQKSAIIMYKANHKLLPRN